MSNIGVGIEHYIDEIERLRAELAEANRLKIGYEDEIHGLKARIAELENELRALKKHSA